MADNRCVAIKSTDGHRCSFKARTEGRCNNHHTIKMREGPNRTELHEIGYVFNARIKRANADSRIAITALGPQPWTNNREAYTNLLREVNERQRQLQLDKRELFRTTHERQLADIARTGINPDAVQDAARAVLRQAQDAERQARIAQWQIREAARQADIARGVVQVQPRHAPAGHVQAGLGAFANDRQNVHTTAAVKQTLNVIKEILKIEVPSEYRWNMTCVSKTMSEIISECGLSPASAWQMVAKYCSDETIYDLQPGIYGKVLDCVWQYIKNSPVKGELMKILKSEMKDNIGMCAQGNLSRLTNILAGYVDCVVAVESMQDKLGRLLPPLVDIEDIAERLIAAARIFVEVELPPEQWEAWASGLLIDQEPDDAREMFIHDGMIDFIVFT